VGGVYAASAAVLPLWYRGEAEVATMNEYLGGPLWIESGIELAGGDRVTWADFYGSGRAPLEPYQSENGTYYASLADANAERDPLGREYILIIPGERYNEIVLREAAVFTAAGLMLIGAGSVVTRRRRPI
jgi:LPXTG-motif cell wall-anchored protein